jgi:hypothetical protein
MGLRSWDSRAASVELPIGIMPPHIMTAAEAQRCGLSSNQVATLEPMPSNSSLPPFHLPGQQLQCHAPSAVMAQHKHDEDLWLQQCLQRRDEHHMQQMQTLDYSGHLNQAGLQPLWPHMPGPPSLGAVAQYGDPGAIFGSGMHIDPSACHPGFMPPPLHAMAPMGPLPQQQPGCEMQYGCPMAPSMDGGSTGCGTMTPFQLPLGSTPLLTPLASSGSLPVMGLPPLGLSMPQLSGQGCASGGGVVPYGQAIAPSPGSGCLDNSMMSSMSGACGGQVMSRSMSETNMTDM